MPFIAHIADSSNMTAMVLVRDWKASKCNYRQLP